MTLTSIIELSRLERSCTYITSCHQMGSPNETYSDSIVLLFRFIYRNYFTIVLHFFVILPTLYLEFYKKKTYKKQKKTSNKTLTHQSIIQQRVLDKDKAKSLLLRALNRSLSSDAGASPMRHRSYKPQHMHVVDIEWCDTAIVRVLFIF